ncbi:hypothetical protein GGI22_002510, partial [Coemansia erecta]
MMFVLLDLFDQVLCSDVNDGKEFIESMDDLLESFVVLLGSVELVHPEKELE